ncbi:hypothetical protein CDAR_562791 [Caerostris darwini]|uniref:Uncharacterized protein n=1 Tax=Caerostris darwini TaxID=1538125 RepID=A0AAV4X9Y9_9ARAC|nr:hypothetical protein CDAR_562791 [Caerostris darwini]
MNLHSNIEQSYSKNVISACITPRLFLWVQNSVNDLDIGTSQQDPFYRTHFRCMLANITGVPVLQAMGIHRCKSKIHGSSIIFHAEIHRSFKDPIIIHSSTNHP